MKIQKQNNRESAYCNENIPPNLEDSKIVGGYSTTILKFPYQVLVILQHNGKKRVCGGSILNEEFILTAAHCVDDVQSAAVAAGITDDRETEKLIPVKHFEHHPNYNPKNFDYDVAYLQLCEKLNLDGRKKDAVHIVKAGSQVPGSTKENGTLSHTLRAVEMNIVSTVECRKVYGNEAITQRKICAGVPAGGKDTCQGDSGGPLVYSSTKKQVGIVSSGYVSKLPYQVLVVVKDTQGRYLCGGSILNEEYILTAGHCVYLIKNATVRAGITDDTEPEKDNPYIPAKRFAYHPLYDPNNSDYDVGFLQLSQKLNLDGWKRKAVHLVQAGSKVPVGAKVTASGWGTTTENGTLSNILNEVEVNVVSPIECRKVYGKDEITQRMICAGVPEGGKDACQGDSGGPLVYSSTKKQVGIVSIGIGCARPGTYCKISLPSFLEDDKIVGGNETSITKFPYQVIVAVHDSQGRYVCGGSILNEEYILTAAHCVYGMKTAAIRAGLTNKREPESKVPLIPAKRFMHHPLYNETNSDYDVGFIQLSKKLNLHGPKEKAVHIVQAGSEVPFGAKVIVSGWGLTKENGTLSDVLRAVELNIVSVFECRKVYGKKDITQRMICAGVPKGGKDNCQENGSLSDVLRAVGLKIISVVECRKYYGKESITQRMICAGAHEGGKDACQGDSGGPLVFSSTKKQVGIVSGGDGCARPGVPGIYTNLANPGIRRMQSVEVGVGSTERETVAKIPLIQAKCFVHHPLYNATSNDYDVGYLKLCKPLNLDGPKEKAVHIVQAGSKVPVGAKVTVSGWGKTVENGSLSDVLRAVELNIISVVECRKYYGKETITQRMICAGVREGGKDTCQGDSGGPLVYSSTRKQVGIVSSGYGCARPGVPGIYTNLANPGIRSWIKKHTGA
ncbi:unnamed protein product [Leptidea sinapis]|uniref:Peptidase S1 domain-containing protein n=1 Tax=Leptidea sinapis TaxID=189913 RepID=A0A5E4Q2R8_9NEOP|nr:unnamed protein product [Leptidea sinapis]